ncbi:MAG TPA: hypothetical protein VHW09_18280 [Bryobacteraceae bacterium]|nr:hypothetical protein [Bryobacteraceae bacterium]
MELADIREIEQLKASATRRRRTTRPVMTKNSEPARYESARHKSRRCGCGECATCKDNARWERIFAEKFADHNYYGSLAIRRESPLHQS